MKNIFKKNHIIITALAIMIVIAGYLSFTNTDTADEEDALTADALDSEDYEEFTQVDGADVVTDADEDLDIADADTAETAEDEQEADASDASDAAAGEDNKEESAEAENSDEADQEEAQNDDTDELSDISDEDLLATAQDVSDNGELDLEEGVPGEAVLANAAIDPSYFISTKLEREQVRAKNKETYMDIMESEEVSDEQKQDAIDAMLALTDIAEKENATEMLLEAKGFDGAVVFISDGKAEIVVNAEALTDQQLAIIESVATKKTGISVENIGINPVVVSE